MKVLEPMEEKQITRASVTVVMVAALIADVLQMPATLAMISGIFTLEGVAIDLLIDLFMAGLTTCLLGFHWALLPTCVIEAVPVLEAAPTWTGCVSFVAWRRRGQLASGKTGHYRKTPPRHQKPY